MNALTTIYGWWDGHGTKILGTIGAIIPGLLGIDGLISVDETKYWLAAGVVIGAMTVQRGFNNSQKLQ